jgi:hypothetical protein
MMLACSSPNGDGPLAELSHAASRGVGTHYESSFSSSVTNSPTILHLDSRLLSCIYPAFSSRLLS